MPVKFTITQILILSLLIPLLPLSAEDCGAIALACILRWQPFTIAVVFSPYSRAQESLMVTTSIASLLETYTDFSSTAPNFCLSC
ncbi:MAG: hypothetical protein GDA38_20970 [Hormoscilla sp. SP12CHS1]|nr:hypothetical protein [Hormoscilla sp. SP12CHS1]